MLKANDEAIFFGADPVPFEGPLVPDRVSYRSQNQACGARLRDKGDSLVRAHRFLDAIEAYADARWHGVYADGELSEGDLIARQRMRNFFEGRSDYGAEILLMPRAYLIVVQTAVVVACYEYSQDGRQLAVQCSESLASTGWKQHNLIERYAFRHYDEKTVQELLDHGDSILCGDVSVDVYSWDGLRVQLCHCGDVCF